jgi:hypothetical protein
MGRRRSGVRALSSGLSRPTACIDRRSETEFLSPGQNFRAQKLSGRSQSLEAALQFQRIIGSLAAVYAMAVLAIN